MSTDSIIAALSAIGTWAAVACALVAVSRQNRTSERLVSLQLSLLLINEYDSDGMQVVRSRLAKKLLANPDSVTLEDRLLVFFENVAHLSRRRLLDRGLVWNAFAADIPYYWAGVRNHVIHLRLSLSDQSLFEEFESMASTLSAPQRSPIGTALDALEIKADALRSFLLAEASRSGQAPSARRNLSGRRGAR